MADGKWLLYYVSGGGGTWVLPLEPGGEPRTLFGPNREPSHAMLSPDRKWVACDSGESGRSYVYLAPFGLRAENARFPPPPAAFPYGAATAASFSTLTATAVSWWWQWYPRATPWRSARRKSCSAQSTANLRRRRPQLRLVGGRPAHSDADDLRGNRGTAADIGAELDGIAEKVSREKSIGLVAHHLSAREHTQAAR